MHNIEITIQYSPEDLQKAYMLHFGKLQPFRSRTTLFLGILLIILGALLMVLQIATDKLSWSSVLFVIYGILVMIYFYWRMGRMGKVAYKKLTDFQHPFSYSMNEAGLKSKARNASSENNWEHYEFALISKDLILLYPNKLRFVLFPKKYFSEEQFIQLREWITAKVRCKAC